MTSWRDLAFYADDDINSALSGVPEDALSHLVDALANLRNAIDQYKAKVELEEKAE